jgi:RNA-splicing ligase RtcB
MIELKGKYNKDCKILTDDVELEAYSLIQAILDQPVSEGIPVRIQCDTHVGKGIVIGFCMPLNNTMLNPNHIGVDIGCGMLSARFSGTYKLDLPTIDRDVKSAVPMGFNVHTTAQFLTIPFGEVQEVADRFVTAYNKKFGTSYDAPTYNERWLSNKLKEIKIDEVKFWNAIGTLGGGNHFLEMGVDSKGDYWITIHCGSRNFGLKVADYWNNVARSQMSMAPDSYNKELDNIKQNTFPKSLIPKKIQELRDKHKMGVNKEYLQGDNMIGYMFDMIFAQKYAEWNRSTILSIIQTVIGIKKFEEIISTVHNYIDPKDMIIRKGAISSYIGQKMIIPFNQKDGILLCEGKSNPDFLFSGPHGAGRKFSRSKAKEMVTVAQVEESMKGIYTTSVCKETLDESVFAYKKSSEIERLIEPTATIIDRIIPIWNVKDTGKQVSWKEKRIQEKADKLVNVKAYRTDKEKDIRKNKKEMRKVRGKESGFELGVDEIYDFDDDGNPIGVIK